MASLSLAREAQAVADDLATLAIRDAVALWRSADLGDLDSAYRLLLAETPALVRLYGEIGAEAAVDSYAAQRVASDARGTHRPTPAAGATSGQVAAAVRWSLQPLGAGAVSDALARYAGSVDRLHRLDGRRTILANAGADPACQGVIRVARPDACAFCLMLASRGQEHVSLHGDAEGDRWHRNCKCAPAPTFPGDDRPDPNDLYQDFIEVSRANPSDPEGAWRQHVAAQRA